MFQSNTNSKIINFFEGNKLQPLSSSSSSSPSTTTTTTVASSSLSWWNLLGVENEPFWDAVNCLVNLQCSLIDEEEEGKQNNSQDHLISHQIQEAIVRNKASNNENILIEDVNSNQTLR